ncbi:hypothetical protein GQ457_15G023440 [Hibiscus cannabinus]
MELMVFSRIAEAISGASNLLSAKLSSAASYMSPALSPHTDRNVLNGFGFANSGNKNNLRLSASLQDFSSYHRLDPEAAKIISEIDKSMTYSKTPLQQENVAASFSKEKGLPGGTPILMRKWVRFVMAFLCLLLFIFVAYMVCMYIYSNWSRGASKFYVVLDCCSMLFTFDRTLSYTGHFKALAAVQVTELVDGVFIGCSVNHAVIDGTSFWHFFNTFAEITKGASKISKAPDFCRETVFNSQAVLKFPPGGPTVTFTGDEPLRERILHFSREAILKIKYRAIYGSLLTEQTNSKVPGKLSNDNWKSVNSNTEISSFQSLCAQLWRSVTRARNLEPTKMTKFRMAVNCRHKLDPKLNPYYFGNAIQTGAPICFTKTWWRTIKKRYAEAWRIGRVSQGCSRWETLTMGSSPRFLMYNNDFGWGKPLAVRSGRANKFDGKISAFPGREENGSIDLEVVSAPETMAGLENDAEIMQYVSEMELAET